MKWLYNKLEKFFSKRHQREINRLRKVMVEIMNSRPDKFMDVEREPELVEWICDTCHKCYVERYPKGKF
jgi:hypothetical protein